ncbi:hypothetical protein J7G27_002374 [Vibrio vulnificus]|nr:hypothetical protein [Vibrio vulnificus]
MQEQDKGLDKQGFILNAYSPTHIQPHRLSSFSRTRESIHRRPPYAAFASAPPAIAQIDSKMSTQR